MSDFQAEADQWAGADDGTGGEWVARHGLMVTDRVGRALFTSERRARRVFNQMAKEMKARQAATDPTLSDA